MANVLLIEPNKVLARACAQGLTHAGHTVTCAYSGQAAIDAADAQSPDAVVLEPQLAGHDGIAFLHEFRSYPEWQQIPVILYTHLPPARIMAARQALERDMGVRTCLYKPQTSLEQLIRAVNSTQAAAA